MAEPLSSEQLDDPVVLHMNPTEVTVRPEQSVAQALESVRKARPSKRIVYIYVVDDEGVLRGVVPTRALLVNDLERTIAEIMDTRIVSVSDRATVMIACEQFLFHRYLAFPVVGECGELRGVIDVSLFTDEVFSIAEKQSGNDAFSLIGVHLARARSGNAWESFGDRFPWLLCNIGGGITAALLASAYESLLAAVVVLSLFIPVVLALAESVSIQSMSLTIQGFHEGEVQWKRVARDLLRELKTGALLGVGSGVLVGVVVWLWRGAPGVGFTVALSMALSIITAALLGVIFPTIIHALRRDPKIAAGPIVLAVTDLATLMFYFNLAGALLKTS